MKGISAARDLLVSQDWLAARLGDPSLRIFDCRFSFDDAGWGRRQYLEGHVPGAQYLDWTRDISEPRGELQYMLPSRDHVVRTMERLGVSDDSLIVAYDDEGEHYSSRLWLVLRYYGHDVFLLDGGWTQWASEGRPVRRGEEPLPEHGNFSITEEHSELVADAEEVLRATRDPSSTILDVRRWSEFTGHEVRSRRGGRVPGARWMLWQENLRWSGDRSFRPLPELRQRYEQAGITPEQQVITYCHGAVRAAHTAFTLRLLGYEDVRVYDGSWEEWGSREDLPVERGEP